jgi:hypothetical protein
MMDEEERQDIDESECSSNSNAFSSGKSFWMNLLEQKDNESQGTEESRQRKTPLGREIQRSWSVGSSLSGFISPKGEGLTPHSAGSISEDDDDDEAAPRRKKAVLSSRFKSPGAIPDFRRSSSTGADRHILTSPQTTRQPQATPTPTPGSSRSQPTTTKLNSYSKFSFPSPKEQSRKLTTPREFGGDVTNIFHTSAATPMSASSTPRPLYQQQSQSQSQQQRVPEFVESRRMKQDARTNHTPSPKTAAIHHRDRQTAAKHCMGLPNSVVKSNDSELPGSSTNDSKGTSTSQFISAHENENEWRKASPKADPIIEIIIPGISSPDSAIESLCGKMQIATISPKADHQDRFQWAYDQWYQAGIMKRRQVKREVSPRVINGISKFQATASKSSSSFPAQSLPIKTPQIEEPSLAEYIASTPASITNAPSLDIHPVPSTKSEDTDQGSFRDLLKRWRKQSDDKPNTHFLSPEHDMGKLDYVEMEMSADKPQKLGTFESPGRSTDRGDESPNVVTSATKTERPPINETPLVTKRIKEYDRDYFDRVREGHTTSPGDELVPRSQSNNGENKNPSVSNDQDGRNQSVTPVAESTPSSDEGEDEFPSPFRNFQGMADSDMYEDGAFAVKEPTRALVILENKETFEVMVGDTKKDKGHDLVIRNLAQFSPNNETALKEYVPCQCSGSVFSGNDDLISFFLPQMGMACICGKQDRGLFNPDVPTGLENVLRPWQVDFLKSFGIYRGEQLVKARHRSGDMMAKALRQWRKKNGMAPFKTASCGMAIHIWAQTCKSYVRSIRKQVAAGNLLLERQPGIVPSELSKFLKDLPDAPKRQADPHRLNIEIESQVEV